MSFENHIYEAFASIKKNEDEKHFKAVNDGFNNEIAAILKDEDISQISVQKKLIERQNIKMEYRAMYNKEKQNEFADSYISLYRNFLSEAKSIYEIHMLKAILEQQKIYAEDDSFFLPDQEKAQLLQETLTKLFSAYEKIISKTNVICKVMLLKEKLEQRKIESEEELLSFFTEEEISILFSKMDAKVEELDRKKPFASVRKKPLVQEDPAHRTIIQNPKEKNTFLKKGKEALAS